MPISLPPLPDDRLDRALDACLNIPEEGKILRDYDAFFDDEATQQDRQSSLRPYYNHVLDKVLEGTGLEKEPISIIYVSFRDDAFPTELNQLLAAAKEVTRQVYKHIPALLEAADQGSSDEIEIDERRSDVVRIGLAEFPDVNIVLAARRPKGSPFMSISVDLPEWSSFRLN